MSRLVLVAFVSWMVGCATRADGPPRAEALVGTYSHGSIDSALRIDLRSDFTYSEYFLNFSRSTPAPSGKPDEEMIPQEPRGSGSWVLKGGAVILTDEAHSHRRLRLMEEDGVTVLVEHGRTYRKLY